ncbi:MAG: glycosyltransferase, partial [Candidatus Helarchaeota archaeon]
DAALPTFRFKILNPKRLIESSDLSTYLDAANRVQQVRNDIAFILTGSGHLKKQIREEIRKRKLKNAFLFDPIPHHVMPVAYNSVDLIVITSRPIGGVIEGISISILEAMASEKPVIASAVGGSLSIISDGQDGYLIPPSDPVTLAEKILELIENKTLRIEMGRNARKKILLKYERDEAIERILMIYQKTLQNTY